MRVKASDFVFSYRRIMDPATGAKYAKMLYPIANAEKINKGEEKDLTKLGAKAIDDLTLELSLGSPTPYFLEAADTSDRAASASGERREARVGLHAP